MIFDSPEQVIKLLEKYKQVPDYTIAARKNSKTLKALINGDFYKEELIKKIEFIETDKKAKARKQYSREITDLFERLFNPIENVFNATGGSKTYKANTESQLRDLLAKVNNIRGGKTIQQWLQAVWMETYHTDPNGIVFMEYLANDEVNDIWTTYKSINDIRAYAANGRQLEWLIFEPLKVKLIETNTEVNIWRVVDDLHDWFFLDKNGSITFIDEPLETSKGVIMSFEHPFGVVPGYVNSDIIKIGTDLRLSPIQRGVGIAEEYARDLSVKIIYKAQKGFPLHWRYVTFCKDCTGTGKTGDGQCKSCDGKGITPKQDVTDIIMLPTPQEGDPTLAPNIAGFISQI